MVSSSTRRSPAIMPKLLPASQDSAATRAESALRIAKQNEDAVTPAYLSMNLMWLLRLRGKKASELESSLVFETLTWTEISPQATAQLSRIREAIRNKEKVNGGEAVTHLSFRLGSRGNMISKLIADFVLPEDHLEPLLLPKGEEPEPGRVAPRKNVPKARAKPPTRPTTKNLTSPTKEETPSTRLRTRKHGTILDDDQASESGVDKKQPRKEAAAHCVALSPLCRPRAAPAWPSLRTAAPLSLRTAAPVPPPCMAHSPYCRHPAWPSLRTAAPLHATTGPDLHCPLQPSLDSSSPALCYLRVLASLSGGYWSALPPPFMALSPHCRPRPAPFMAISLRTAAPLHGPLSALPPPSRPLHGPLSALPPPFMALSPHCRLRAAPLHGPLSATPHGPLSALPPPFMALSSHCRPRPAPLHGPLSALPPPCMALSPHCRPRPAPCTDLSQHCRPPAWPSLRTAAPVPPPARTSLSTAAPLHGPLSAHCRLRAAPLHGPLSATPHGPLSALPPPCMPRQGLISTVLFNRLWTAPHPLFVIYGVFAGFALKGLLVCPAAPLHGHLSALPPPSRPCMALSQHCCPRAAPLHGPLSAMPPLCMALSPHGRHPARPSLCALPPPCRPPARPTLRTAATPHGPLSVLPPPCMPRQGLISTVLFNRLWTAPHPLFVISGCWLRSQEATGLHSLRTAAPLHGPLSALSQHVVPRIALSPSPAAWPPSLPPPPGLLPRVEPVTLPLRTRRSSCWATVITAYFHGEKLAAGRLLSRENKT
ncbi:hypothetical protein PAPYR_11802 [Paratrimastix pyriformis]|uniref:Uncharacterized protein n=1 Tax=Paratrimastix pyriformis TaxID=342808 RepID=A0ABQ8U306_9EUKA|nr:hypothetical protein PAPYR_11802 [Paratrimastix pyriformis]